MPKFRVSWVESRFHYIDVDAGDESEAVEKAEGFDYGETASDESAYGIRTAVLLDDDRRLKSSLFENSDGELLS